jgi:hypothetical protein
MSDGAGSERRRSQPGAEGRTELGYHARSERRTARRAARRRKAMTRLSVVAGPVVVLILVVVVLLVFLGGPKGDGGAGITSTTAVTGSSDGSSLLVVEQEETTPALVLLLPVEGRGLALAMPGTTLVKTGTGFKTLAELHGLDQDEALEDALAEMLGVSPGPVASVQWPELRDALAQVGEAGSLPAELESNPGDAALVAGAAVSLLGADTSTTGTRLWEQMEIGGDSSGFRDALGILSASIPSGEWEKAVLPGRPVEGVDFEFYEPEVQQAKALLAGEATGTAITLEVQNGSGVVGVAQRAADALASLGYTLLPFSNAEGFPDVKQTLITAGPDATAEAERVRQLLGVGKVERDDAVEPGHIIVIVGKDFVPALSTETESTG